MTDITNITKIQFYDTIYKKNGSKAWPSDIEECVLALYFVSSYNDLSRLLREQSLWMCDFHNWSFKDFAFSALYFYFEDIKKKEFLPDYIKPCYPWFLLMTFLLNVETTHEIYFILEKNNFNKSLLRKNILDGFHFAFDRRTFNHVNITCLENLLKFLEIDHDAIKFLLGDFDAKKTLKLINKYILVNKLNILTDKGERNGKA